MAALKIVVTVIYLLVCAALVVLVLMQEGKQVGLSGAISGAADTFWGKNKARSMEGKMALWTKILCFAFIAISVVLNLNW